MQHPQHHHDRLPEPVRQSIAQQTNQHQPLPHPLRHGMEALTGHDLSGVRVHYNSHRPTQLGAVAYSSGNDVYLAPGQERHLGHELAHVVQQRGGHHAPGHHKGDHAHGQHGHGHSTGHGHGRPSAPGHGKPDHGHKHPGHHHGPHHDPHHPAHVLGSRAEAAGPQVAGT